MAATNPHIAILPTPGMGHLIPLVEFARNLHRCHHISSTLIVPTDGPAQSAFLSALPPGVDHLLLPPVNFDDLQPDAKIETRISLTVTRSLPSIRAAVKSLIDGGRKPAALVVDLFGTDGFEAAADYGIPPYIFYPSCATVLSLFLHLPKLDQTVSSEFWEVAEKLNIPGCIPIHGRDLLDPVQDRQNEAYKWLLHHTKRYRMAHGIILNSFKELEPGPIEYLQGKESKDNGNPTVYPIGPLVQKVSSKSDAEPPCGCIKWLDEQPSGSVLFISFGSGGTLSHDQITELALGLELSEQRFLWVLRCPSGAALNRDYFSIKNNDDPLAYLPEGFAERTSGRGLVVPLWAPQARILAHESVSAFLTHCGWNSILESVANGVPMIAWPLYAEQRTNAVILEEEAKVAVRAGAGEKGLVGRVEMARVVKGLMEGEEGKEIRCRIRDLKDAAANAVGEEGHSAKLLAQLAHIWKAQNITNNN